MNNGNPEIPVNTDPHLQVFNNLEKPLNDYQAYRSQVDEAAMAERELVAAIGLKSFFQLTRQNPVQRFIDNLNNPHKGLVTKHFAKQRELAKAGSIFRKDNSWFAINERLNEVAPTFSSIDNEATEQLKWVDPGVRDAKEGDTYQLIDNHEQVATITDPLKFGEAYLCEFLLSPVPSINRQGWEVVIKEANAFVRRRVLDVKFDEAKNMVFVLDPNIYDAMIDLSDQYGLEPGSKQVMAQTLAQAGRRMQNQTINPPVHYATLPTVGEEDLLNGYIVLKESLT